MDNLPIRGLQETLTSALSVMIVGNDPLYGEHWVQYKKYDFCVRNIGNSGWIFCKLINRFGQQCTANLPTVYS